MKRIERRRKGKGPAVSVSLINMKGGVGKTTVAAQIAHAASARGLCTLAVDLDPQANLSQIFLGPKEYRKLLQGKKPTVVQLFEEYAPANPESGGPRPVDVHKIILKNVGAFYAPSLDLIPSRLELSRTLKKPAGKERQLASALSQVAEEYDLILIDCAPTESILTEAAYYGSRYVLVPVRPEFLATIGLPLLEQSVRDFRNKNADHTLDICGVVINHPAYSISPEGKESIGEVDEAARRYRWHVFEAEVRWSRSFARAAREGTPINSTRWAQRPVKKEFSQFVDEFFDAIGLTQGE